MKIGIITHYYKSKNYGGNLQAFALQRAIEKLGYNSEQICYSISGKAASSESRSLRSTLGGIKHRLIRLLYRTTHRKVYDGLGKRNAAIDNFNRGIPNSKVVYNADSFSSVADVYDVLITGSDQVWHPSAVCDAYLLCTKKNGGNNAVKLSYAASCSVDTLPEEVKARYQAALRDYSAVSVREENAVGLISPICPVDVEWALDPVFLLDSSEWDKVVPPRKIDKKYVFCYFLGADSKCREIASDFAAKNGYLLVTLPYLNGEYRSCDKNFGDIKLFDVSPADFISLIKYAEYIFTDSFHAMAFSGIYQKQYFVFERRSASSMNSRIYSLSKLLKSEERFCDSPEKASPEYVESVADTDYTRPLEQFEVMKESSVGFLYRNLGKAKEKKNKQ